jgi:hypothetical protein
MSQTVVGKEQKPRRNPMSETIEGKLTHISCDVCGQSKHRIGNKKVWYYPIIVKDEVKHLCEDCKKDGRQIP